MIVLRTTLDVDKELLTEGVDRVARDALDRLAGSFDKIGFRYDPDADGPVILSSPDGDDPAITRLLGASLSEVIWEAVEHHREDGCFEVIVVSGNSHATTILIPDTEELLPAIREKLLAEAAPPVQSRI